MSLIPVLALALLIAPLLAKSRCQIEAKKLFIIHEADEDNIDDDDDEIKVNGKFLLRFDDLKGIKILAKANWFDLKKCYYQFEAEIIKKGQQDSRAEKGALKYIKSALVNLRNESKILIFNIVRYIFCEEELNKKNGVWINLAGAEYDKAIKAGAEDPGIIPEYLKKYFPGDLYALKCDRRVKSEYLFLNAFGSEAPTSDYDFNLFIFDQEIYQKPFATKLVNQDLHIEEFNMINPMNKNEYFNRSNAIITRFYEVSDLVVKVYAAFEKYLKVDILATLKENKKNRYDRAMPVFAAQDNVPEHLQFYDYEPCISLNVCFDSNAYPDTMVINGIVFKEPLKLIKKTDDAYKDGPGINSAAPFAALNLVGDSPFGVEEIKSLVTAFMRISYNGLCNFSYLPLSAAIDLHMVFFVSVVDELCVERLGPILQFNNDVRQNNELRLQIFEYNLSTANQGSESHKDYDDRKLTFGSCMQRHRVNNINNFDKIYEVGSIISICTLYLEEAYYTYGALEYFKFASKSNIYLPFVSVFESFLENMTMSIIHLHEKSQHDEPVNSQSSSDVFSKYTLRGINSLRYPNYLIEAYNRDLKYNSFNFEHFLTGLSLSKTALIFHKFEEANDPVMFIPTDLQLYKSDSEALQKKFKEMNIHDIFLLNDYRAQIADCIQRYFNFFDRIAQIKKKPKDSIANDWFFYVTDEDKKKIYLNEYLTFINERSQTVLTGPVQEALTDDFKKTVDLVKDGVAEYEKIVKDKLDIKTILTTRKCPSFTSINTVIQFVKTFLILATDHIYDAIAAPIMPYVVKLPKVDDNAVLPAIKVPFTHELVFDYRFIERRNINVAMSAADEDAEGIFAYFAENEI